MVNRAEAAKELLSRRRARADLLAFTQATMPEYQVSWHHRAIARQLMRLVKGEVKRLMLFTPPRHGKSQLASRHLPAYVLGLNPAANVISCSYSAGLAERMGRDVQRIIEGPAYARLFPRTRLGGGRRADDGVAWQRTNEIFETAGEGGSYRATGVGGGITGMGFDCFPGETVIRTESGDLPISTLCRLQYPPRVMSYNHTTRALEWKNVVAVRSTRATEFIRVSTDHGRVVRSTADHRFYVREFGYRPAGDLYVGAGVVALSQQQNVPSVPEVHAGARKIVPGVLPIPSSRAGGSNVRVVQNNIRETSLRSHQKTSPQQPGRLLLSPVFRGPSRRQESETVRLRAGDAHQDEPILSGVLGDVAEKPETVVVGSCLREMCRRLSTEIVSGNVLLQDVPEYRPFHPDARRRELTFQDGHKLRETLPRDEEDRSRARWFHLRGMPLSGSDHHDETETQEWNVSAPVDSVRASSGRRRPEQQAGESHNHVHVLPQETSLRKRCWEDDSVSRVERLRSSGERVYDIQVEGNCNFFAGGILVHNCGIIDDPIKNKEEADSPTMREKVWEWYTSTFWTRQAPGAKILLILTRWHVDDLAGRLIKQMSDDPDAERWEIVNLPAVSTGRGRVEEDTRPEGEPLWPDRFGKPFMVNARATLGSADFEALYQGNPTDEGGNHFKLEWFEPQSWEWVQVHEPRDSYRIVRPDGTATLYYRNQCPRFVVVDPAASEKQSADYTAIGVFALTPTNELLILDMHRERLGIDRIVPKLRDVCQQWQPDWVGMEANGFQVAVARQAQQTPGIPAVRELSHEGKGKLVRATPAIIRAENHQIYLPRDRSAPWVKPLLDELATVKLDGNDPSDDQADVIAYAVIGSQGGGAPKMIDNTDRNSGRRR